MDLQPGTEYEVRLELRDPDGVAGEAVRTLKLKTRSEPALPALPVEVRHVYPPDYTGEKEKPFFENLMHAVNGYPPICDTYQTIHPNAARPGTVIKMHAGVHAYDNRLYWKDARPQFSYWLHGTITLVANGTPEHPIYIVGAGDGEAILDGRGCHNLLNVRSADYLHFEGLIIRNTDIAFFGGFQGERGGGNKGLTVRNCWIENVVYGFLAQDGRSEDFTLSDNVILGRNPADRLAPFGRTIAGYAVTLAGQGHAVCHNYAANFWDGIDVFTSSLADPRYGQQSRAIDFYNNDIHNCIDQFIEADGGYANLRMLRNRCFNCSSQPLSVQPVHAGPVYWIRNLVWNACGGKMTLKNNNGAQVLLFLHNTSSTHMKMPPNNGQTPEQGTWIIQNNLSIGPRNLGNIRVNYPEGRWNPKTGRADIPAADAPVVEFCEGTANPSHIIDHNAYTSGIAGEVWMVGKSRFPSLVALREATGYEKHSLLVNGYEVFANAPEPPHARLDGPLVLPQQVDLRLKPGTAPVDAGARIAGINDAFTGKAPDIGAYELNQPLPVYGPRPGPYLQRLEDLRHGKYLPVTTTKAEEDSSRNPNTKKKPQQ
jgi:hypothetical protein